MTEKITSNTSVRSPAEPAVLNDPLRNRGVAFTLAERQALGLTGRLPSGVLTLEEQARRAWQQLQAQPGDLAKNVYMEQLHDRNEVLYYRVLLDHLAELLPVVYDPTVGDAIERYSHEYRRPRGIYLSIDRPDDIEASFATLGLGLQLLPGPPGLLLQGQDPGRQPPGQAQRLPLGLRERHPAVAQRVVQHGRFGRRPDAVAGDVLSHFDEPPDSVDGSGWLSRRSNVPARRSDAPAKNPAARQ